jgi:hypothetical protein
MVSQFILGNAWTEATRNLQGEHEFGRDGIEFKKYLKCLVGFDNVEQMKNTKLTSDVAQKSFERILKSRVYIPQSVLVDYPLDMSHLPRFYNRGAIAVSKSNQRGEDFRFPLLIHNTVTMGHCSVSVKNVKSTDYASEAPFMSSQISINRDTPVERLDENFEREVVKTPYLVLYMNVNPDREPRVTLINHDLDTLKRLALKLGKLDPITKKMIPRVLPSEKQICIAISGLSAYPRISEKVYELLKSMESLVNPYEGASDEERAGIAVALSIGSNTSMQ